MPHVIYDTNNIPPNFGVGRVVPEHLNPPTTTITPDANKPNRVTVTITGGTYTYGLETVCVLACQPPLPAFQIRPGYLIFEGNYSPALDLSGLPTGAIVSQNGNTSVIDTSQIPAGQCQVSASHEDISHINGTPLYPSGSFPIALPGCGTQSQSDQQQKLDAKSGTIPCPTCDLDTTLDPAVTLYRSCGYLQWQLFPT